MAGIFQTRLRFCVLFCSCLGCVTMKVTTATNITIVTCGADRLGSTPYPLQSALDVMFADANSYYSSSVLQTNSSISHIPLYYKAKRGPEVEVFFRFYYENQHLFTPDYSERFTAIVITDFSLDRAYGPLALLKSFVRGVPILLAAIDPQQVDYVTKNGLKSYLNLIPSRDSDFFLALRALAIRFQWTKTTVVCGCRSGDRVECPVGFYMNLCQENIIARYYEEKRINIKWIHLRQRNPSANDFNEILDESIKFQSRVILLLLPRGLVRLTMIHAFQREMTDKGDYVFITIQLPLTDPSSDILSWKANDLNDTMAARAFNSLLVITKLNANQNRIKPFIEKVVIMAEASNRTANISLLTSDMTIEVMDMIPLILQAVNRLSFDLSHLNPETFVTNVSNQSYEALSGPMRLDSFGSVVSPVLLLRFDKISMTMQVVAEIDPSSSDVKGKNRNSFLWFGNEELPSDIPQCGIRHENCIWLFHVREFTAGISSLVCFCFVAFCLTGCLIRWRSIQKKHENLFIDIWAEIALKGSFKPTNHEETLESHATFGSTDIYAVNVTTNISLRQAKRNRQLCATLLMVQEAKHPNLAKFIGITFQKKLCFLCGEFSERGSLHTVIVKRLHNNIRTDLKFRLSFMADIIEGLVYIHKSKLKLHGGLTSRVCIVTSRFSVKIAQAGYSQISTWLNTSGKYKKPEVKESKGTSERSSQSGDVYNTGRIFLELFKKPAKGTTDPSKISVLANTDYVKHLHSAIIPDELEWIINSCLNPDLANRPCAVDLQRIIRRNMSQLEEHAENLEKTVKERNEDIRNEMEKVDFLLRQMLPKSIIKQLRNQETVKAELFESATVLFSDIPIFSEIAGKHAPWKVVEFLNATYSVFDQTLVKYDVYKVETINDSYLVASGIPIRNGIKHATEICSLSLNLRDAAKNLQVPLTEKLGVGIRIGINSGTIAAGIVGKRMPRYCLFGDALNTASRMESHGKEDGIHVGTSTRLLAHSSEEPKFDFEPRGLVDIKGKGRIETYWLLGYVSYSHPGNLALDL